MRAAVIVAGQVANVVEVEALAGGMVESVSARIGDVWDGVGFTTPPPRVPRSISRRQGRRALLEAGKLLEVEAAIAAIEDEGERLEAQVEYESETWDRDNPMIARLGALVGLDEAAIDALFLRAAEL